jgi:hypothetical protein
MPTMFSPGARPVIPLDLLMTPGAPGLKLTSVLPDVTAKTFSARTAKAMSRINRPPPIAPTRVAAPVARLIV